MATLGNVWRRQNGNGYDDGLGDDGDYGDFGGTGWWWSPAGMAARYAIVGFFCVVCILGFIGGYWHAQSRMRKGLPPLAYHRWMVRQRGAPNARQHAMPLYNQGQSYDMQQYPPPPPMYNQHEAPPPAYAPPDGGSKVMPNQNITDMQPSRVGESSAPHGLGVPPATVGAQRA